MPKNIAYYLILKILFPKFIMRIKSHYNYDSFNAIYKENKTLNKIN